MPDETVKFSLGDRVRHKAAGEDDNSGIVTGITFRPGGVQYEVTWGPHSESTHYDLELEASADALTT